MSNSLLYYRTYDICYENVLEVLTELCWEFDISGPLWLGKHEQEYEEFRHTQFLMERFMESMFFQRQEAEYLNDDDRSRKSRGLRN